MFMFRSSGSRTGGGLPLATLFLAATPIFAFQAAPPDPPEPPMPPEALNVRISMSGQSFLGVGVAEVTSNRAHELKLKDEFGVEVTRVENDSAAAKAGLKVGDVVLEYNGQRVEGAEQFIRLVHETPAGREIKVQISRNGVTQTIPVTIGTHKNGMLLGRNGEWFDMPELPPVPLPDMPRMFTTWNSSMLGIEAESLNSQLGDFFGVKEGVLVRSVVKGTAAEKAGLKAGDVITKVDQTAVTSPSEVTSAVRASRSRKTFPIELVRDHKPITLNVTMEAGDDELRHRTRSTGRTIKL